MVDQSNRNSIQYQSFIISSKSKVKLNQKKKNHCRLIHRIWFTSYDENP